MDPVFDHHIPFSPHAAVVVCKTEYGNLHAGILHSKGEILHLGWEDSMSNKWHWRKLWVVPDAEPEELFGVAALCRLVWEKFERERTFPYGIRFAGSKFDSTGGLIRGPNSRGLTCATFVLAIFGGMGIDLVTESDWPVRRDDDLMWLKWLSSFATSHQLESLAAEIDEGVVRIRPEEVSGACMHRSPCCFHDAVSSGKLIIQRLDSGN